MARSTLVYVTYIRTTPEKLWSALTGDLEFMKRYWFGVHCESQWTAGSSWKMVSSDGQIHHGGRRHRRPSAVSGATNNHVQRQSNGSALCPARSG